MQRVSYLKNKLVCILWQAPPNLLYDPARIKIFVRYLRKWPRYLYSFEFRNESWFNDELYNIFRENNINLCIANSPKYHSNNTLTSTFVYLRFHGSQNLYGSKYSPGELKEWADNAKNWMKGKNELFAFFNNDYQGFAVENALEFNKLINNLKK